MRTAALRFASSQELPPAMAYEQYIFETARCPTRENLHDFFNGLCWLQLAACQEKAQRVAGRRDRAGGCGRRTRAGARCDHGVRRKRRLARRTACDMGGPAGARLATAVHRPAAFVAQARVVVFGHALLEKLVEPRKDITAHVLRHPMPAGSMAVVDRWLAGQLTAELLAAKPFTPLPVMGIPGWTAENETLSFYDDPLVFRPARAGNFAHLI